MPQKSVIDTLIELASQESEEAARALSAALQRQNQSLEKLRMLTEFKNEYAERLNLQLRDGLSVQAMVNFRDFLADLEKAVEQQQRAHNSNVDLVQNQQRQWQAIERKKLSYGTLAQRAQAKLTAKANKQDQKLMDEMASRSHRQSR